MTRHRAKLRRPYGTGPRVRRDWRVAISDLRLMIHTTCSGPVPWGRLNLGRSFTAGVPVVHGRRPGRSWPASRSFMAGAPVVHGRRPGGDPGQRPGSFTAGDPGDSRSAFADDVRDPSFMPRYSPRRSASRNSFPSRRHGFGRPRAKSRRPYEPKPRPRHPSWTHGQDARERCNLRDRRHRLPNEWAEIGCWIRVVRVIQWESGAGESSQSEVQPHREDG